MHASRRSEAGFTLLEIMLVMALLAVVVAVVLVNYSGDSRDDKLKQEAYRFQQLFHYAAETALMRQQEWGVLVKPDGYKFLVYLPDEDLWQPVETPASLAWHQLPEQQQLQLELEGLPWQQDSLLGALSAQRERLEHLQTDDEEEAVLPHIFILSSGEITPFELLFQDESQPPFWYLQLRGEFSIPLLRTELLDRAP